jgi:hypothetical protein
MSLNPIYWILGNKWVTDNLKQYEMDAVSSSSNYTQLYRHLWANLEFNVFQGSAGYNIGGEVRILSPRPGNSLTSLVTCGADAERVCLAACDRIRSGGRMRARSQWSVGRAARGHRKRADHAPGGPSLDVGRGRGLIRARGERLAVGVRLIAAAGPC